jgi:2,3-bisphosphoglycerate-independent phosphoglycerate mutase
MSHREKVLVLVMDGLGDRAIKDLDFRTPLQAARRPNMNWYVKHGSSGIMDVIAPGVRPGSDTSHLAILGYDPFEVYTGRGPFEAAGVGLVGRKGDVAFRCNFATVDDKWNVVDRRAGRIKEPETTKLVRTLSEIKMEGLDVVVKEATEHRAVLLLRGKGLSPCVSDVDPHSLAQVRQCRPLVPEARKTAKVVNDFVKKSYHMLKDHPVNIRRKDQGKPAANILLPRGAGMFPDIQSFEDRYGLDGACVAGVSLIKGICRVCGMEVVDVPGATGGLDTDMNAKADAALNLLRSKDLVLVNVKATDIASHDGDLMKKIEAIERIDEMVGLIRRKAPTDAVVVLLADHCTPIEVGDHSGDPVPVAICSESTLRDGVGAFDEVSASRGGLGRIRGRDLMPILLDKVNRSEKFGA